MHTINLLTGKSKLRELILDYLRGIAVILMITAHSIYFYHDQSNSVLSSIARFGNANAFTIFLFASGAASFFAFIRRSADLSKEKKNHIVKRTLILLFGYYVISFISYFVSNPEALSNGTTNHILKIIIFWTVPSFAEFLLPFVFFSISLLFFSRIYKYLSENPTRTLTCGGVIYLLGYLLFLLPVPDIIAPYKAIFVGEEGYLRFPIFSYAVVFFTGLSWGRIFYKEKTNTTKSKLMLLWLIWFSLLTAVFIILTIITKSPIFDLAFRWPPSLGFLSISLTFVFVLSFLFYIFPKEAVNKGLWKFIFYVGQDSYDLYLVHIIILYFYQLISGRSFVNPIAVAFMSMVTFFVSVAVSSLNWKISPSLFTAGPVTFGSYGRYRVKKRYVAGFLVMLFILIFAVNTDVSISPYGDVVKKDMFNLSFYAPSQPVSLPWFNNDYGHSRQLTVINSNSYEAIKKGETGLFMFDHNQLVREGKSKKDGSDLTLVYQKEGNFYQAPILINNTNTKEAGLIFEIQDEINVGSEDNNYFLYYDSDYPIVSTLHKLDSTVITSRLMEPGDEKEHVFNLKLKKRWYLKDVSGKTQEYDQVAYLVSTSSEEGLNAANSNIIIEIVDEKSDSIVFSARNKESIDLTRLPIGIYSISAKVINTDNNISSPKRKFYVSSPVYVAWTLDWEGWDINDNIFRFFDRFAEKNGNIPFTQFVNPRLFLPGYLSEERRNRIKTWLVNRIEKNGDEIALHVHVFYDLVEKANVVPNENPQWGHKEESGYDVLLTSYTQDEAEKIISYSLDLLKTAGLPAPKGFRAGGWFADEEILAVLKKLDFYYDSSGRERIMWGGAYYSPWDLTSSAQPYHPQETDINIQSSKKTNILEIPNNGGNTYEHTQEELIQRFKINYFGGIAREKKAVIFMSHIDWGQKELQVADKVLSNIRSYSYEFDEGPVVFTTLGKIYSSWTN